MTLQRAREEEMIVGGRVRADAIEARTGLAHTPHGRHFISAATMSLEKWLDKRREWLGAEYYSKYVHAHDRAFHEALLPLSSGRIAFATVNTLMNCLMKGKTAISTVVEAVGRALESEIAFTFARSQDPHIWNENERRWKKHRRARRQKETRAAFIRAGIELKRFDLETRLLVGNFLVQATQTHTAIFRIRFHKATRKSYVELGEDAQKWLEESREAYLDYRPRFMACVEPPVPWTNMYEGGFHDPALSRSALVAHDRNLLRVYDTEPVGDALEALNVLQKTAFTCDRFVHDVYAFAIDNDRSWGGLVKPQARPIPAVVGEKGSDIWEETKRARGRTWRMNEDEKTKRYVQFFIRRRSQEDLDRALYFVHQLDSRGRMYPLAEFFQPQGPDHVRGMLLFNEAVPVETPEALRWLKIAGANAAGLDKKPFDERVKWVDDNHDLIEAIARDPYSTVEWRDFDAPWTFLSFANDYVGVLNGRPSRFPVGQDGTCNGLQLWSLALRDEELARRVNVLPVDAPQDIYSEVGRAFEAALRQHHLDEPSAHSDYWMRLLEFYGGSLPRDFPKRPVMTKPYSVTKYAIERHFMELIHRDVPVGHPARQAFFGKGMMKRMRYGTEILWDTMAHVLRAAHEGMLWLQNASDVIFATSNGPSWVSPSGMYVSTAVRKSARRKIELVFGEKTWRRDVKYRTDQLDPVRIRNSVAPNYIHSLDAAVAHKLVRRLDEAGVPAIRSVHDSFAVHAAHAGLLSRTVREVLVEVFSPDLLSDLRSHWQQKFHVELPPLPVYGDLDINLVLNAEYAFC